MVSSRAIKLTKILGSQDATKISLVSAFLGNQPAIERVVIENEFAALQKDGGLYFEYNTEWEEDQHDNNIVVAAVLDPLSEPAQRISPLLIFIRDTLKVSGTHTV